MNTKKEIVKFLNELAIGVQGKRDNEEAKIKKIKHEIILGRGSREDVRKKFKILRIFELAFEHTEGQLFEINYILDTITRNDKLKN